MPQELRSAALAEAAAPAFIVRPLDEQDRLALLRFGAQLPEDDWLYLEDDFRSPEIITRFVNAYAAENWRQLVAVDGQEIVGYSIVRRLAGWSSHVGDIGLVVADSWRRRGVGTMLARAVFDSARELNVSKLIVEMLETQCAGRGIFERLGFRIEGHLSGHARDHNNQVHDMLIMSYHIEHALGDGERLSRGA